MLLSPLFISSCALRSRLPPSPRSVSCSIIQLLMLKLVSFCTFSLSPVQGLALDTSQLSLDSRPSHASPVTSVASSASQVHDYNCGPVISDPIHAHDTISNVSTGGNSLTSVLSLNLSENHHTQSQQQQQQQLTSACTSTSPSSPQSSDKFFNRTFKANTLQSQFEQFRVVDDNDSVPMVIISFYFFSCALLSNVSIICVCLSGKQKGIVAPMSLLFPLSLRCPWCVA